MENLWTITELQFPVMTELFLYKMLLCCYAQTKGIANHFVEVPVWKHCVPNPGLHKYCRFGIHMGRTSFAFSWADKENMRGSPGFSFETVYQLKLCVSVLWHLCFFSLHVAFKVDCVGIVWDFGCMTAAYQACHHPYISRIWTQSSLLTGTDEECVEERMEP